METQSASHGACPLRCGARRGVEEPQGPEPPCEAGAATSEDRGRAGLGVSPSAARAAPSRRRAPHLCQLSVSPCFTSPDPQNESPYCSLCLHPEDTLSRRARWTRLREGGCGHSAPQTAFPFPHPLSANTSLAHCSFCGPSLSLIFPGVSSLGITIGVTLH